MRLVCVMEERHICSSCIKQYFKIYEVILNVCFQMSREIYLFSFLCTDNVFLQKETILLVTI